MIPSDSRYIDAAHEFADTHTYDEAGGVEADEDTALTIVLSRDTTYLIPTQYGTPPPKQYMAKMTDNIQLLSYRVQQDPTQWWILANANPHIRHPMDLKMGDLLHLPD